MQSPATCLRRSEEGGARAGAAPSARRRFSIATAMAILVSLASGLGGCVMPAQRPLPLDPLASARVKASIEAGLELYDAGDYVLSARRFRGAADLARDAQDRVTERKSTTAECTAWLRAQHVGEFARCSERLELLHRRSRRSDPGLNTLLVMGAVAGKRPIPPFRVPSAVRPALRAIAQEVR